MLVEHSREDPCNIVFSDIKPTTQLVVQLIGIRR